MLIREAIEADLPEILEVLKGLDEEDEVAPFDALSLWRKINEYPYYKIIVVEDANTIIATCSLIIIDSLGHQGAKLAVAENVIVSPKFRGRGIGSQMMLFIMEKAKEQNCYKLMLSSSKKRVPAHRFYAKLGFKQHGISFLSEAGKNE